MDCEQAITLISAEIDREIQQPDRDQLAAHLHECSTCTATAEAFRLQHTDMRQAFEKWREGAALAGERVIAVLPEDAHVLPSHLAPTPELRRLRRRLGWALTAAAVVAAVVLGWQAHEQRHRPPIVSDRQAGRTVAAG